MEPRSAESEEYDMRSIDTIIEDTLQSLRYNIQENSEMSLQLLDNLVDAYKRKIFNDINNKYSEGWDDCYDAYGLEEKFGGQ